MNPPEHGPHAVGAGQSHDWAIVSVGNSKTKKAIILRGTDSLVANNNINSARKKLLVMAPWYEYMDRLSFIQGLEVIDVRN